MTSNMINYRNYQESVRHNREMERLTGEQQAEVVRHQKEVEAETARSNKAQEALKQAQNVEAERTNRANEYLKAQSNSITGDHYGKQDFETARHNSITEYYELQYPTSRGKVEADIGYTIAKTDEANASAGKQKQESDYYAAKTFESQQQGYALIAKAKESQARAEEALARAGLLKQQSKYYASESVTKSIKNVTSAIHDVGSVGISILKYAQSGGLIQ